MTNTAITIIVCTYNRANDLAFLLESLAKLRVPAEALADLLIVDNNSTDHTKLVIEHARGHLHLPVQSVFEPRQGLAFARNRGLARAAGDIIAFTDDDCVVTEDWLVRIHEAFRSEPEADIIGGRVELYDPSHYPITIKTSRAPEWMGPLTFPGGLILGCNMAMRRGAFDKIGGFDERFGAGTPLRAGEDAEYFYRAYKAGYRLMYNPDVVVYHNHGRCRDPEVTSPSFLLSSRRRH